MRKFLLRLRCLLIGHQLKRGGNRAECVRVGSPEGFAVHCWRCKQWIKRNEGEWR